MSVFDAFKKIESERSKIGPVTYIIAGLGNMGREYDGTRHNAGFNAVDFIAEKSGVKINRSKFDALIAETEIAGARVLLMKPQTYMNASGNAVGPASDFYKIAPEHVIILCDDISFDPGKIRIRREGSAGGHNGLKSIAAQLGTDKYPRIKIGVGQKPSGYDMADFVLAKLSENDRKAINARNEDIFEAVSLIIGGNTEKAMNLYN